MPAFTDAQYKAIIYIPRVTGTLSIIGSVTILYHILSDWKRKLSKVKNRFLVSMSVIDIINSLSQALATIPVPRGTAGVYGAVGTSATCTLQGAAFQLGVAVPLYNCALCLYYLLVIRYSMTEEKIARFVEPALHGCILCFAFGVTIAGGFLDLYHSNASFCWLEPYPYSCVHKDKIECTKAGKEAYDYQWYFSGVPLIFSIFCISVSMTVIFVTVRTREVTIGNRQSFVGQSGAVIQYRTARRKMKRTRAAARQALLYVGAYFATYFFSFYSVIYEQTGKQNPFAITALVHFFMPLQGFLNFVIYIFPQYTRVRRANRSRSRLWALRRAIFVQRLPVTNNRRCSLLSRTYSNVHNSITALSQRVSQRLSTKEEVAAPVKQKKEILISTRMIEGISPLLDSGDQQGGAGVRNTKAITCKSRRASLGGFLEELELGSRHATGFSLTPLETLKLESLDVRPKSPGVHDQNTEEMQADTTETRLDSNDLLTSKQDHTTTFPQTTCISLTPFEKLKLESLDVRFKSPGAQDQNLEEMQADTTEAIDGIVKLVNSNEQVTSKQDNCTSPS